MGCEASADFDGYIARGVGLACGGFLEDCGVRSEFIYGVNEVYRGAWMVFFFRDYSFRTLFTRKYYKMYLAV